MLRAGFPLCGRDKPLCSTSPRCNPAIRPSRTVRTYLPTQVSCSATSQPVSVDTWPTKSWRVHPHARFMVDSPHGAVNGSNAAAWLHPRAPSSWSQASPYSLRTDANAVATQASTPPPTSLPTKNDYNIPASQHSRTVHANGHDSPRLPHPHEVMEPLYSVSMPPQQAQQLQEQVAQLSDLVRAQQALMASQQAAIEELRSGLLKVQQTAPAPSAPSPAPSAPQLAAAPVTSPSPSRAPGIWETQQPISSPPPPGRWDSTVRPFEAQRVAIGDRRLYGFDARFHSASMGATPRDFRILPANIILVRHAESEGNQDETHYTNTPDPQISLTALGHQQAHAAGQQIKQLLQQECSSDYKLFFYTSPYRRSLQTYQGISAAFSRHQVQGVQQEVQLREQDMGNFQDAEGKKREKAERLRYGRFFYRFPNGESGADVYDRLTLFEDHLIRDINAGRFGANSNLVLVTHGLALRVFLMRWFHWTCDQFLDVYNPPNAVPLVLQRVTSMDEARSDGPFSWVHTKALYRLTEASKEVLRGCSTEMCSSSFCDSG